MVSSADYLKLVFCSKALNSAGFKTLLKVLTWPQPVLSCYEAALTLQQQVWEAIQTSDHPLLTSPQLPGGCSRAANGRVERLWAGLGEMLGDI